MIVVGDLSVRVAAFSLAKISFTIPTGEYGILMGRTGSGKTTLLETICGLKSASGGSIKLHDRDVTHLKPAERGIGYVPQDKALFTTMSVRENLAFGLRIRKWSPDVIDRRVKELAQLLGLQNLLDRKPHGLSGGEAQRVALGRALASRPGILCLDEPLSALDDETREEMRELLRSVREHTGVTALHVTHHLSDAQKLADRILLLKDGSVRQVALDEMVT
jgi:ABC-type sugar transport system ATPase subunit